MDVAPSLPDDVLSNVLGRLAPRGLAASRCVCKSWRRVVDSRRLLRADLLPLSLGGIFLNFNDLWITQFLSRPTTGATVYGRLDYTCHGCEPGPYPPRPFVYDHCNGLLLLGHCVVNPATRQWAFLPQPPDMDFSAHEYLVFDPTLSPNYFELIMVPDVPDNDDECEWPPATLILPVFSSQTGSWEERIFGREGEAAGMLPGLVWSPRICHARQSAYWQGALYIWYSDCHVLRISLSDNKYRVIRLPIDVSDRDLEFYLGKSAKGIYFATLVKEVQPYGGVLSTKLKVWFLDSPAEWLLKYDRDIFPILPNLDFNKQCNRPWILQEFECGSFKSEYVPHEVSNEEDAMADNNESLVEEAKFEWDSDNDDILEPGSENEMGYKDILGFHPYKEVILLSFGQHYSLSSDRVLAYHWTTSKIQDLGRLFPKFYLKPRFTYHHNFLTKVFPYTPCWLGELPEKLNGDSDTNIDLQLLKNGFFW